LVADAVCAEVRSATQFQHEGAGGIFKPEIPGWHFGPDLAEMLYAQFMPDLRGCVRTEDKTGIKPFPDRIKWIHDFYPVVAAD
jgi:hypothetical protein